MYYTANVSAHTSRSSSARVAALSSASSFSLRTANPHLAPIRTFTILTKVLNMLLFRSYLPLLLVLMFLTFVTTASIIIVIFVIVISIIIVIICIQKNKIDRIGMQGFNYSYHLITCSSPKNQVLCTLITQIALLWQEVHCVSPSLVALRLVEKRFRVRTSEEACGLVEECFLTPSIGLLMTSHCSNGLQGLRQALPGCSSLTHQLVICKRCRDFQTM
jgi:hypothetical protein